jgi:hypothetical protein
MVSAPLYRPTEVATPTYREGTGGQHYIKLPETIERYCQKCDSMLTWNLNAPMGSPRVPRAGQIGSNWYSCRNCGDPFAVWMSWNFRDEKPFITKYGEYPQPDIGVPKQLAKALGGYEAFWRRGLTLRHHGYGIGALVYFRRIVEGITKVLLELLAAAMEAAGDPAQDVAAVRELIEAKRPFEEKMRRAAELIPAHLRPTGSNPFQTLFDIVSGGLHGDTDEECCDLVDALAGSMVVLVAKLNQHVEERKAYEEAAKKVERLRAAKGLSG